MLLAQRQLLHHEACGSREFQEGHTVHRGILDGGCEATSKELITRRS
jgi:hypothetical protein